MIQSFRLHLVRFKLCKVFVGVTANEGIEA